MARYDLSKRGYVDIDRPKLAFIRIACEIPLRSKLVAIAEREDVSLSEVVRRACREYLEDHR
jgi:hypothetical protein